MKSIFTSILILISCSLFSQQSSQQSMYMLNPYHFNEAYAGHEQSLIVTADIRKQWINLTGSPSSQNLTLHLPLYILKGGIGLQVENDQLGASRNMSVKGSYNYILDISEKMNLSVGASFGIIQHTYDGSQLRAPEGDYEPGAINHNDLLLSSVSESAISPTFGASLLLSINDFDFGLSANNLSGNEFKFDIEGLDAVFSQSRHFFAYASYGLEINDFVMLRPTALMKTDLTETQVEVNLLAKLDQKFLVGGGFRGMVGPANDAFVILAGIQLNEHFTISYSYDLGLSSLNSVHNGSHEFLVQYNLNKKIGGAYPPNIKYNPRFL